VPEGGGSIGWRGSPKHRERIVNIRAVAFCVAMMAAGPALAQPWGPYGPRGYAPAVSAYQLHATLRAHGLRPITQPVLSGYYLVVRAVDGYGDVVRVLVNARYGNIVSIVPLPPAPVVGDRYYRPAEPYRPYQPHPRYGTVRPDLRDDPAPLTGAAPAPVPQAQQPAAANRPPLPRPRPAARATTAIVNAAPASAAASAAPSPEDPATTGSVPSTRGESLFPPAAPLE
jgi:hypothetical protein